MLDLKKLENDFESLAAKLESKGVSKELLSEVKALFARLKEQKSELENLQAFQNKFSKELANAADKEALKAKLSENKTKIAAQNERVRELESELESLAHSIPNVPFDSVPVGADESENVELKRVLSPREFDFEPREHFELGEQLGWLDFARGVKIATSRFCVLKARRLYSAVRW